MLMMDSFGNSVLMPQLSEIDLSKLVSQLLVRR